MVKVRFAAVLAATALLASVFCGLAFAADAQPVQMHGYLQNRGYLAEGGNAEFRSERISISALAALPEDSSAYVEVYYHPALPTAGLYLESAYYDTALQQGRLRVGKGRRLNFGIVPAYPNRKTSNYGIVSEAFTQDRIQGVQYNIQKDSLDVGVSAHTAYRLGSRNIGEIPGDDVRNAAHVVPHLCMRENSGTSGILSRHLQLSGRLGGKWGTGLKAGLSYSYAALDARDLANMNATTGVLAPTNPSTGVAPTNPLGGGFTSKKMNIWGVDATYKSPCGLVLQGEYYSAKVSDLEYAAWNAVLGLEMKSGWKFFTRYAEQNMNTPLTDNPLSWDTKQISVSLVQPLRKALWIQYEYEFNMENTDVGRDVIDNNIFFVELFTGF